LAGTDADAGTELADWGTERRSGEEGRGRGGDKEIE
jgi:hypothetical protein